MTIRDLNCSQRVFSVNYLAVKTNGPSIWMSRFETKRKMLKHFLRVYRLINKIMKRILKDQLTQPTKFKTKLPITRIILSTQFILTLKQHSHLTGVNWYNN